MTTNSSTMTSTRCSVCLYYSGRCSGSLEWAEYLTRVFAHLSISDASIIVRRVDIDHNVDNEDYDDDVVVLLVSPVFIATNNNGVARRLGVHPDRVVAILLGVADHEQLLRHCRGLLTDLPKWVQLEARDHDVQFVQTVVHFIASILAKKSCDANNVGTDRNVASSSMSTASTLQMHSSARSHISATLPTRTRCCRCRRTIDNNNNGEFKTLRSNKTESVDFHVHPKKVTRNHSRFLIVLERPIRCFLNQALNNEHNIYSNNLIDHNDKVYNNENTNKRDGVRVWLERAHAGLTNVEMHDTLVINPYTIQVDVPVDCFPRSYLAGVHVELASTHLRSRVIKIESVMGELEQLVNTITDPIQVLSSVLAVATVDDLDIRLAQICRHRGVDVAAHDQHCLNLVLESIQNEEKQQFRHMGLFPTLLHFACYHGLSNLTLALLESPVSQLALQQRDRHGRKPLQVAAQQGHFRLLQLLEEKRRQLSGQGVQGRVGDVHRPHRQVRGDGEELYLEHNAYEHVTNCISGVYQVPPPPRPVLSLNINNNINKDDNKDNNKDSNNDSDRFGTMRAHRLVNRAAKGEMKESSLATESTSTTTHTRSSSVMSNRDHVLELTEALLSLLERFQNEKLSKEQMEALFDNWKVRADSHNARIHNGNSDTLIKDKSNVDHENLRNNTLKTDEMMSKEGSMSKMCSLFKLIKSSPKPSEPNKADKTETKDFSAKEFSTKDFNTKDNKKEGESNKKELKIIKNKKEKNQQKEEEKYDEQSQSSDTTWLSGTGLLNEAELSVIICPVTPKSKGRNENCSISSQILPLERLSLSRNEQFSQMNEQFSQINCSSQGVSPVATSESSACSVNNVVAEYIYAVHDSPMEPDVLNTPKSLNHSNNNDSIESNEFHENNAINSKNDDLCRSKRQLWPGSSRSEMRLRRMPPLVTDM